jgi:hypothetical protein
MLNSQHDHYRRSQECELDVPSHGTGFAQSLMWHHDRPCRQSIGETLLERWPPGDLRISTDLFVKKGNHDDF